MKRKLLLLAAFVASALGMRAQTDVTSTYLTNADFEGDFSQKGKIGSTNLSSRYIYVPDGWTDAETGTFYKFDCSVLESTHEQYSNLSGTIEKTGIDRGSQTFGMRFVSNSNSRSLSLSQSKVLPKGNYRFSIYLIADDLTKIETGVYYKLSTDANPSKTALSNGNAWTNVYTDFTVSQTGSTVVGIYFDSKSNQTGVAGADNAKLTYNSNYTTELSNVITYATYLNTTLNNSDLATAILHAEGVVSGADHSIAYQTTIDNEVTALQNIILSATAAHSMSPNTNATGLIYNPGFELSTASISNWTGNSVNANCEDYSDTGWKNVVSSTNTWSSSAIVAYGGTGQVNSVSAPSADNAGNTGNTLGVSVAYNTVITYQSSNTVKLPAGHYTMKVWGNNQNSSASDFVSKNGFVPTTGDPQLSTKTSFTSDDWEEDNINIALASATEGRFQIGGTSNGNTSSSSNGKVFFDNITLTYLGNMIQNVKEGDMTLGTSQSLTADKWYKIVISEGGTYNITADTPNDLVYVMDGTLVETSAGTEFSLTNDQQNLTDGTYYVKSSSAQNLTISLASYDYEVGDATVSGLTDGNYIQTFPTSVTYTYSGESTTDPDANFAILNGSAKATLKKGETLIAEGTLALAGNVLTATFPTVTLDRRSTYTVTLPAGTVGYAGKVSNSETVVTVYTPYVFDGLYFIKNTAEAKYMTFGGSWGTRATLDEVGNKHQITALSDGTYKLRNNVMNDGGNNYIKIDGSNVYSNGTSGQVKSFTITEDGDIKFPDEEKYLGSESANKYVVIVDATSANTKWEFIKEDERDATIAGATGAAPVDITYKYIQNPNLANYSSVGNNWTSGGTNAGADHTSYNNSTCVDKNMQHWNTNFDTYITWSDLPTGVYQFSAAGFYRAGDAATADAAHTAGTEALNAFVYANNCKTPVASIMEGVVAAQYGIKGSESSVTGGYVPNDQPSATFYFWNDNFVTNTVTVLVSDGKLRFGMKKETLIANDWSVFDNFRLKYLGNDVEANKAALANMIAMVTREAPTSSSDPFKPAYQASDLIAAQAVYDNGSATVGEIQTAISDLYDAFISLNAPDEDDVYSLYLVDGLKKTVTFYDGNEGKGGYAIGYTQDAGSFYNQAIHFKSTGTTNQYKLYIEEADGTPQYLCDGTVYSGGDNFQIRVTTDESKALPIEVIATNTADVYNLRNTVANALIGSNGGSGFYTAQTYKNFNINPASTVSVGVNVKAGKWATRIFPFNPTLPAGVVAYTAEVNGNSLNLTEVASPAANVPYILKNTTESDVNENLSGYGTAKQDAYTTKTTSVDLTGIYTAASIPVGSYVLQTQSGAQGFFMTNAPITGVAYRVYLTVPGTAEAKAFYLDFDDTTGIDSMNGAIEGLLEGEVYDLGGRLVKNPTRGIYIVNGKKVLIK